jgi:peptidoglycan hydrolase-like protein with peptidoglycan-binding domain
MAVVLRPGDSNDLVRLLQARLNRDYPLYSNLVVDGIYGPRTTAVVREFQRRAGLTVDGIDRRSVIIDRCGPTGG